MFNIKKLLFLFLIFIVALSISGVSANDSLDNIAIDNYNHQNDLSIVSVENFNHNSNINSYSSNGESNLNVDSSNLENNTSNSNNINIQEMIDNAKSGDTLVLSNEYIKVNAPIIINKPLTIDGKGSTFDGKGLSQLFYIHAELVILKNLNFINAKSNELAGAIFWNGSCGVVSNCYFVNNSA